ncbi:transport protein particle component [Byssothecium circinans]|uniref:Transport protein particle component n=1 Tax=Byssothecium circinans TaxID=147558 RepID=A0A6A5TAM0_9PLEO|nr:transport protein particle component [Byssothecium circinans]
MATPTPATGDTAFPDPTATYVSTSSLDFLLIELVPMAYRISSDLAAREEEWLHPASSNPNPNPNTGEADNDASSTVGASGAAAAAGTATVIDEEEAREAVFHRLESLGYRVGLGIVERVSRTTPRPSDPLSTIKFLCKDLWTLLFRKQIDNLKTNHRGIYVLTDNTFKPLTRMSFDTRKHYDPAVAAAAAASGDPALGRDANSIARAQPFLYFPAGLVRGCLAGLGVTATVTAESSGLPAATFQIRTVGAKA